MVLFLYATAILSGCTKNKAVYQAFDEAKSAAYADPGPAPRNWKPDVRVQLSRPLVDALVTRVLEDRGTITGSLRKAGASIEPEITLGALALAPSNRCDECMAIDVDFSGVVRWVAGPLGSGDVPLSGTLAFDVALDTRRDGDEWTVTALPRDVRRVELRVQGWSGAARNLAEEPVRQWLDKEVVSKLEPIPITTWGGADLPVRALSVRPHPNGLTVDLLTTLPHGGDVSASQASPRTGFVAFIHPDALIAVARRAMFDAGPQTWDVVPEPRSLTVDNGRFELGLRLWKVSGAGWWRDYTARGALGVERDAITLAADGVTEGEKSKGAAIADPLFWLGEGIVQSEMQKAIAASLPGLQRQRAGGVRTLTRIRAIDGASGALRVTGELELLDTRAKAKVKMKAR